MGIVLKSLWLPQHVKKLHELITYDACDGTLSRDQIEERVDVLRATKKEIFFEAPIVLSRDANHVS
jgi:hypothetical protein